MKKHAAFLIGLLFLSVPVSAWEWGSGYEDGTPSASSVKTNTSNFNGSLSSADNTVQKALDTLDAGGGSGAPTDADYLVGTANGDLSAEIVVGTSPGGELGGTWASPTIDDGLSVANWSFTESINIPNGTGPTTDAAGELAFDTDAQGSGRGSLQIYDGTANTNAVAVLASDTCTNGQIPTWNTGGTWTCEDAASGGISGSTGSTDNSIIRANGTGGSTAQGTSTNAVMDDDGNMTITPTSTNAEGYIRVLNDSHLGSQLQTSIGTSSSSGGYWASRYVVGTNNEGAGFKLVPGAGTLNVIAPAEYTTGNAVNLVDNEKHWGDDTYSWADIAAYTLSVQEQSAAPADVAGVGQIWVKNDTPNTLWFTDDAGTDHQIAFV